MTEFSTDELVDCIRHNIALLDDSGLADRVLLSPRRHAVPGGLPLELCQRYGEEEEAGPSFSHFELEKHYKNQELYSKTSSKISQKIHDKLLAQLNEIESIGRFDKQAFLSHQVPSCTLNFESKNIQEIYDGQKSLTSRLIAKAKCNVITDNSPPFIEFAKFEAMEDTVGAKRFRIVFHSVNSKEKSHILTINILKTAFIDDLIGLACHIYTRKMLNPSCESPSMYDLYLAEEDLSDFDIELPPLDRKRRVAECGFLNLAIIKKSFVNRRLSLQSWKQNIRIYLVDGRCYTMNNVEGISLREVFEYALQRKVKENNQTTNTEVRIQSETLFHDIEYQLEPLNSPGLVLDLNKSVSSSGIFDFILIRKNSSRGDFDTLLKNLDSSDLLLNKQNIETTICFKEVDYQRPLQLISLETSSFINQNSLTDNSTSNKMEDILNGGSILEEYSVNKIRRFKPKILSRLVIRENCLELIQKGKIEKDDDLKRKIKRIPWKLVASVEVPPTSEKRHSRFVRITFFVSHNSSLLQYILKAAITDKPTQENLIFDGSYWKVLFIEAEAHEAWKIGVKLNEQLDINPSLVHLLYRYSLRTSLKPKIAAEKASIIQKQFPSSTSSSAISSISKNEKGFKKKLSAILSIKKF